MEERTSDDDGLDVSVLVTLAGGALLLACADPESEDEMEGGQEMATVIDTVGEVVRGGTSVATGIGRDSRDVGEGSRVGGVGAIGDSGDNGGDGDGADAIEGIDIEKDRRVGVTGNREGSGVSRMPTAHAVNFPGGDGERKGVGDGFLGRREASLLVGYLCATATTAAGIAAKAESNFGDELSVPPKIKTDEGSTMDPETIDEASKEAAGAGDGERHSTIGVPVRGDDKVEIDAGAAKTCTVEDQVGSGRGFDRQGLERGMRICLRGSSLLRQG